MKAQDQFHVGIVVDDLDAKLAELSDLFGYRWSDEIAVEQTVHVPGAGEVKLDFRFRYSKDQPLLEVIQSQPGTVWEPVAGSGLHHLGYWSDDVTGDGAALVAAGYELEVRAADLGGGPAWAYHRNPAGVRVELITRELEPLLSALWS